MYEWQEVLIGINWILVYKDSSRVLASIQKMSDPNYFRVRSFPLNALGVDYISHGYYLNLQKAQDYCNLNCHNF